MSDELISADDAAAQLRLSRDQLAEKARQLGWRSFRDGGILKYMTSDVQSLKDQLEPAAEKRPEPLDLMEETDETEETVIAGDAESQPVTPSGEETATEELIFEDTTEEFDVSLLEGDEEKAPEAVAEMPELEDLELIDETTETEVEDLAELIDEGTQQPKGTPVVEAEGEPMVAEALEDTGESVLEGVEEIEEAVEEPQVLIPSRRLAAGAVPERNRLFSILVLVSVLALVYTGMFLANRVLGVNNELTRWTQMIAGGIQ